MAIRNLGRIYWGANKTDDGKREYKVRFLIESEEKDDGPEKIINATYATNPLPAIGDYWSYGNDNDVGATRTPGWKISAFNGTNKQDHIRYWVAEFKFNNKTVSTCADFVAETPFDEPWKVSGSFVNRQREVFRDASGNPLLTSSFERTGVQEDEGMMNLSITQNMLTINFNVHALFMNGANLNPIWGMPQDTVKFTGMSWEKRYYGACLAYYMRRLEFLISWNGFLRDDIPNKGKKIISGDWDKSTPPVYVPTGNANNPNDYVRATDPKGKPTEYWLNTNGTPANNPQFLSPPKQVLQRRDLAQLGVPLVL